MEITSWRVNILLSIIFIILVTTAAEKFTKDHKELLEKMVKVVAVHPRYPNDETSEERTERINKELDQAMNFINIIGQIDNFLTNKMRIFIKQLNAMYDMNDSDHS